MSFPLLQMVVSHCSLLKILLPGKCSLLVLFHYPSLKSGLWRLFLAHVGNHTPKKTTTIYHWEYSGVNESRESLNFKVKPGWFMCCECPFIFIDHSCFFLCQTHLTGSYSASLWGADLALLAVNSSEAFVHQVALCQLIPPFHSGWTVINYNSRHKLSPGGAFFLSAPVANPPLWTNNRLSQQNQGPLQSLFIHFWPLEGSL